MTKENEYLNYINEHRHNVMKAYDTYVELMCNELNVDIDILRQNIVVHDESKFSDIEFNIYRRRFFKKSDESDLSDYDFNIAWLHHIHNNPHHPEHWVYYNVDNNDVSVYDMPDEYIIEMVLDWIAMGYKFNDKVYNYYNAEGQDKLMTTKTNLKVKLLVDKIKEYDINNNLQ